MCVYASSITKEQRTASGVASVAGTDREGFDEAKELRGFASAYGQEPWHTVRSTVLG